MRRHLNLCLKSPYDFNGTLNFSNDNKFRKPETLVTSTNDIVKFNIPYVSPTLTYQRYLIHGFLKKQPRQVSRLAFNSVQKRYFVLDHKKMKISIYKN